MDWINLLKELGVFGLIVGAITILINNFFNKKAEQFKNDLQNTLEQHKSKLSRLNQRDSKVFEKRVNTIEELYQLLVKLDSAMLDLVARVKPIPHGADIDAMRKEETQRANNALFDLQSYFHLNKIYFSKVISGKIANILKIYREANSKYHFRFRMEEMGAKLPWSVIEEHYEKSFNQVKEASEELKSDIEAEFRNILQSED